MGLLEDLEFLLEAGKDGLDGAGLLTTQGLQVVVGAKDSIDLRDLRDKGGYGSFVSWNRW